MRLSNSVARRAFLAAIFLLAIASRPNDTLAQAPKFGQGYDIGPGGGASGLSQSAGDCPTPITNSVVVTATPIIQDSFAGPNGASVAGRAPSPVDLPGGTYSAWGSSGGNTLNGGNQVQIGPDRGAAVSISSNGAYTKPNALTISALLELSTTTRSAGDNSPYRGVGLGFYPSVPLNNAFTDFDGLILQSNGSLELGQTIGSAETVFASVPWPTAVLGPFSTAITYTVSYSVNAAATSGGIFNVSVSNGSVTDAADFAAIDSFRGTNFFTSPNTAFAGFMDTSSAQNTNGIVANFQVAAVTPPGSLSSWTGAVSTSWSNSGNWTGAVPGIAGATNSTATNTDTAQFNANPANSVPLVDAGRNLQNIFFSSPAVGALTLGTTGGNALLLTNGGTIQTDLTVTKQETINAPLILEGTGGTFTFSSNANQAPLNFGGPISAGATSGTTTLTLSGAGAAVNTIGGSIGDGGFGAHVALAVQSATWSLGAANTYTGATTVTGGSLILPAGAALGNSAIGVSGAGIFAPNPGSGSTSAGGTGAGSAGATLSIAVGGTFSMVDGAVGTFNLQQQTGFGANTALALNNATLNFDLSQTGTDQLVVGVGKASVGGANNIGIAPASSSLAVGTYPLISAAAGGLAGNFQFAGGATTKLVVAGGATYRLTLNNLATSESVSVAPTNLSLIIQDTLKTPLPTAFVNHAPEVNLPGGVYQDQGTASLYTQSSFPQSSGALVGGDIGWGLPILSAGNYTKPQVMTIAAAMAYNTITDDGTDVWRGVGLGFYSSMHDADLVVGYLNFQGLVLATSGAIDLVQTGPAGPKQLLVHIPWPTATLGAFSTSANYTISYTVNRSAVSGGISAVSVSNGTVTDTADFAPIDNYTGANPFTDANTSFAGFLGSSTSGAGVGLVSNFTLSKAVSAGSSVWTGGAADSNWVNSSNWLNDTVPGAVIGTTNTDTATFSLAVTSSPTAIDANRNVKNITFDTAAVGSMTIGATTGNALLLTSGGVVQTTSTVTNPQTINAPLVLEGNYTFTSGATSSTATLAFGGRISPVVTSGVTTLTLNGSNSGANAISGALADNPGAPGGKLAILASGAGQWILSGLNSYSGGTTISSGKLKLVTGGTNNIPQSSLIDVAAGATLDVTAVTGTGGFTLASGQTLEGKGTIAGGVTVGGGSHLDPGESVGTLTGDALTLLPGSILDYEFNGTSNDFFNTLGSNGLFINGGGFNLLAEGTSNPFSAVGTYHLLDYAGTLQGTGIGALSVLDPQPGLLYSFSNNLAGHEIDLRIAPAPEPSGLALAALAGLTCGGLALARRQSRFLHNS